MNQTVRDTLERVVFAYIRVKYGSLLFQKNTQAKAAIKQLIGPITQSVPEAEAAQKLSSIEEKLELEDQLALQVLIALSRQKKIKAFEIVKERFMGATVKLIKEYDYHVDKNKNYTEIEETAQKAWTKIWKGLDKYDPQKGEFYTWIRTIIIRLIKTSENQALQHTDQISDEKTHEVAQKAPNELGIYDMSGNVSEWCHDYWEEDEIITAKTNPIGPGLTDAHGGRGGCWGCEVEYSSIYNSFGIATDSRYDYIGFRIARTRN